MLMLSQVETPNALDYSLCSPFHSFPRFPQRPLAYDYLLDRCVINLTCYVCVCVRVLPLCVRVVCFVCELFGRVCRPVPRAVGTWRRARWTANATRAVAVVATASGIRCPHAVAAVSAA